MKKGKFERVAPAAPTRRRRNSGAKLGLLILAITMLVGSTLGGTLAYLTDSQSVINTFTVGKVGELTLTETGMTDNAKTFMVIPGVDIGKDPKVSYAAEAEDGTELKNIDAYVLVSVVAEGWAHPEDDNYTFTCADGGISWSVDSASWEFVGSYSGESVYCYQGDKVGAGTSLTDVSVIAGDEITVSSTITKAETQSLSVGDIVFTAYAIQAAGFDTPAEAWAAVK